MKNLTTAVKKIETKVQAGSGAAFVAGVLVWLLGHYVIKGKVPAGVSALIYAAVPGVLALTAGYFAPHTHRPDLVPPVK